MIAVNGETLPQINAFWIGPRLGPIHVACLRSFMKHGHSVTLHVFDEPEDTPPGVCLFDATQLMGREEIFAHRETGSLSFASDIYRYRMLKAGMGIYVDCDIYCLKPFPNRDYLFGWESNKIISNAVLGAPSDSEFIGYICKSAGDIYLIPPWIKPNRKRRLKLRKFLGRPKPTHQMEWGIIGPQLVTYAVNRHGLKDQAMPIDAFYPLHFSQTSLLNEKGLSLKDITTNRSFAIHLANSIIGSSQPTSNTPLYEILCS